MAFDGKGYIQYLVDSGRVKHRDSGSTYASNLRTVAKVIGVDVEAEYEKDECKSLEERRAAWCEEHKGEKGWGNVADGKAALDAYVAYKASLKTAVHYWMYSPGYASDKKWEEFYQEGIMAIAREYIGDLRQYKTREEIVEALLTHKTADSGQTTAKNSSLEVWQFVHELKKGDIIFVKNGKNKIVGKGVVLSDYIYDETRADIYKNIRRVDWQHKGEWKHPEGNAVNKVLTDVTKYSEYVKKLNALFNNERETLTLSETTFQDKYTIEEICNILKIFLARRKNSGEKTAAQNYFYAVYGKYLKKYKNGSAEWDRILETIGADSRGPFSWITSLCLYLDGASLSFADFYNKAKENAAYINDNDREENIQSLQFDLDEILSESPNIAASMYFGFYNALNIKANKMTINRFVEVEVAEIASNTVVNGIRAGSRLYHFIAENEELLTEIEPSKITELLGQVSIDSRTELELQAEDVDTPFVGEPQKLASGKNHNLILFGAPGTGKSQQLKEDSKEFGERYERVTFHPDYTYAHFVGTYKPVMVKNEETEKNEIEYKFVAGPFLRAYLAAKKAPEPFLLIIEEINRANVAAVFGDVFQLLDRDENGKSEYKVAVSEDVKEWLCDNGINETKLCLPENMYIWATMNSADQGVFPMDTAFKRRWNFEYTDLYPDSIWSQDNPEPTYWKE